MVKPTDRCRCTEIRQPHYAGDHPNPKPAQHTFDAYVLGSLCQQAKTYPRRSAKTAIQVALVQADKRGYQIPPSFREYA